MALGQAVYLDMPPIAPSRKDVDKLDFIKVLKICSSKKSTMRMNMQRIGWEQVFANHMCLIAKIYK